MKRYRATILILFIFITDLVTGNLELIGYKNPQTNIDWWYNFVVPFLTAKSVFQLMPYIIVSFWAVCHYYKIKIQFELPDFLMALLGLGSVLLTIWDYTHNNNERPEYLDWPAFIITFTLLLILKINWLKVLTFIGRIPH